MIYLISHENALDGEGKPVRSCVYLCDSESELPDDAPVGSRALSAAGKIWRKGPEGWGG